MVKTKIIAIQQKNTACNDYACGNCFAEIDEPTKEKYCWSCGADLSDDNWAYDLKDLLKKPNN